MKKLSLRNKFSKYIHKSFQKWPLLVQVGSKAQQPPRSPIKGQFWRREYGPSNCTSRSQRKPSSENIPPRRQLQIPSHKSFDQRELRPSQNYVTPLSRCPKKTFDPTCRFLMLDREATARFDSLPGPLPPYAMKSPFTFDHF